MIPLDISNCSYACHCEGDQYAYEGKQRAVYCECVDQEKDVPHEKAFDVSFAEYFIDTFHILIVKFIPNLLLEFI